MTVLRMRFPLILMMSLAAGLLLLTACTPEDDAPGPLPMSEAQYEAWEIALVEMRIEKNDLFADPTQSPLPADRIEGFEGLNYYFPKAEMRFMTEFHAAAGTDTVSLVKRKGQAVPYLKRGTVEFRWEDQIRTLVVYGPADTSQGDFLWLPFYDATSGKETYPAGRYLDITLTENGMVDLDFNRAYNPLCDYNAEKFDCTLPPEENRLPFAVEAGEMLFNAEH